jgi:formylglycine-generating enzyme required for sulfatase activity
MMSRYCSILIVISTVMSATASVRADAQSDWSKARQAEYATWAAAHPNVEAQIADLKAKTAALVDAYKARPKPPRYADLTARSSAASPADKQAALKAFAVGFTLWQSGDFPSAEAAFKQGLDLDPTNGMANFYYGDCLQRRGAKADAADYMARAVFFGGQSAEAFKAQTTLASLPSPTDLDVAAPPVIFRVPGTATELWDGPDTPQMVVVPAGDYTMGSPASEPNRSNEEYGQHGFTPAGYSDFTSPGQHGSDSPQLRSTIGYSFAVGKFDVTRAEYAAFIVATGYKAKDDDGCFVYGGGKFKGFSRASWQRPDFDQTANDPVVCVSYDDAQAYTAWLSQKTGHSYRLLSESEWEYAARGGTTTTYWWGDNAGAGNANCNGCGTKWDNKQTSPSGFFPKNPFGLFDMNGNAWQWTADCWNANHTGSPADGRARSGDCNLRVDRGGSWNVSPRYLRSTYRDGLGPWRLSDVGFRVARTF